ncbi:MAG: pyridine nucleotide-disulfide oxidoreductase [Rhodopseudomonas sp.]|nr:pyridine nucleotide-disulfide oxidoreductase [Rhodopseudomonas sp.]
MSDARAPRRIVVVGAGQAAAQLAISLRQGGFDGGIVVVGDEPYLPYQRPPLSKKFLTERGQPDSLFLRPADFWRGLDVDMTLGAAARAVDCRRKLVTLSDGRELDYDVLVFATGTRARTLPLRGVALPYVMSLRAIGDVHKLRLALDAAERVVIVGGGYIGLEVAAVMRGEGRAVTVVEAEDRLLKRVTSPVISDFFETLHRRHGVDIRLNARLAEVAGDVRATGVVLASGDVINADVVLLATGAHANDELAREAGLPCDDGIVVDELARASLPDIYAIGDCARLPSRRYRRSLRLESVQNAIDQAKAAAASILGQPVAYDPVPWFWSDQYDVKLQIAGLSDGHDDSAIVGAPASGRFSVEYRQQGRLIAVDAVNEARAHMMARRRIAEETATADAVAYEGAA